MTEASRHMSRYLTELYPEKNATDSVKRLHTASIKKLRKYIEDNEIHHITDHNIDDYFVYLERDMKNSIRTIENNKKPIRDFIAWSQANGTIDQTINFSISNERSDQLIDLFSKEKWAALDRIMSGWAIGNGCEDVSPEILYNRKVLTTYIRFMNEARPLCSEIAEALRWRNIRRGEYHTISEVIYRDRCVVKNRNALRILDRWSAETNQRGRDDLIFSYHNNTLVDYLVEIQKMAIYMKCDVNTIVSKMNLRDQQYYQHKDAYDIAHELFEAARQIIIRQEQRRTA